MTIQGLKYINNLFKKIISYQFVTYASDEVIYPYWIGEYSEVGSLNEDGLQETSFILTGTTRGQWLELEKDKKKIKESLRDATAILEDGTGIALFYENAIIIPVDDIELKRMQINITIKEWEV